MFVSAAYTTEGIRKKVNQDAHCVLIAETTCGPVALVVVCDGVGGLSAGELASSTVVSRFAHWFEHEFPVYIKFNSSEGELSLSALEGIWTQLLGILNKKIFEHGENSGLSLGTTFSGLIVCKNTYFIGHVGDCRVYRYRNGALDVLTNDQTFVARELARGNITAEEAKGHPKRNVLLQAVGTQETLRPEFFSGDVQDCDQFLVCCDGFYRRLPDDLIADSLSSVPGACEEALGRTCKELAQQSMERGEVDNITVACLKISRGGGVFGA